MQTKAEAIEKMLDTLNSPDRWCKGVLTQPNHETGEMEFCLMGALNLAALGGPYGHPYLNEQTMRLYRDLVSVLDTLAIEHGYDTTDRWGRTRLIGTGAHAVEFNNAVETEYEDVRMFLKEVLERVS